jgi:hypothetical protein
MQLKVHRQIVSSTPWTMRMRRPWQTIELFVSQSPAKGGSRRQLSNPRES